MIFGWRVSAVEVIAHDVLRPRGLIGFGLDMVDHSGPEIATVGTVVEQEPSTQLTFPRP